MGTYATAAEVVAELAAYSDLQLPSGDALERLIDQAERAVDRRIGGHLVDPMNGRRVVPLLLTSWQREALKHAVAVAVGHLSEQDTEAAFGHDDLLPVSLQRIHGDGLNRKIDAELAGSGLVRRSGCARPDPVFLAVDPLPAA